MRQYSIDEIRPVEHGKLKAYLDEHLAQAGLDGLYWLPLGEELLNETQKAHEDCQPFFFSLELEPVALHCELLVRTNHRMRCSCIGYATEVQRNWLIDSIDAIFEKLGIKNLNYSPSIDPAPATAFPGDSGHRIAEPSAMLQTYITISWTILATILFGTPAALLSFFNHAENTAHRIGRLWGRSLLWVSRISVTVRGMGHIDTTKPYIFMCNHQSNFDIPVLMGHLPTQFRWIAKAELFRIPIFGRGMKGAGYIGIDRSNRESAIQSLNRAASSIRQGASVMIFPEGTRSLDGRLKPFNKGGFILAVDAGVPIVPVVIHGTFRIMPKSELRIRPGPVLIDVLTPIDTDGYHRDNKDELLERVRGIMQNAINQNQQEIITC